MFVVTSDSYTSKALTVHYFFCSQDTWELIPYLIQVYLLFSLPLYLPIYSSEHGSPKISHLLDSFPFSN